MLTLARISLLAAVAFVPACAHRAPSPDRTLANLARAAQNGDCRDIWRQLDETARGGRSIDEFETWCEEHDELFAAQGRALEHALRTRQTDVVARLPIDSSRYVTTVHEGGRWYLDGHVALPFGGDTPLEAALNLAALVEGDGMQAMFAMLSPTLRDIYSAEARTLAQSLRDGVADIVIYGETATVSVGDITIRFVVDEGLWRVDSIAQTYYDDYYYY